MKLKRRDFINLSAVTATGVFAGFVSQRATAQTKRSIVSYDGLQPIAGDVQPINVQEREARIEKAQRLMAEQNMKALLLDAGTSMEYFTGIRWWPSERPMVAVIPAKGSVRYVCPAFEEPRLQERIIIGKEVYSWQEDESPYRQIAKAVKDAGIVEGNIGIEERLRFFILEGVRKEAPRLNYVEGTPVTMPCRIIKSKAELELLQKANDITSAAIQFAIGQLKAGLTQGELSVIIGEAQERLGGAEPDALVLFGPSSAYPHGSKQPQSLKEGDIVLMDCGCSVEGYTSDITRTVVFGALPTQRQMDIWNLEQQAQLGAFNAAQPGVACEAVDAAARKVLTDAGFGPGYKLPGLPHRTGHGIGMDGHEWGNMVKGNKQLLQPGMCFSIEPTIAIPGEFGVRLEDCVHITEQGPQWFSRIATSINEPFGK